MRENFPILLSKRKSLYVSRISSKIIKTVQDMTNGALTLLPQTLKISKQEEQLTRILFYKTLLSYSLP